MLPIFKKARKLLGHVSDIGPLTHLDIAENTFNAVKVFKLHQGIRGFVPMDIHVW